jgi:TM2 domain-containing membrane protein YozV
MRCTQDPQLMPFKSVGLALVLTVAWLGAGHLYADRAVAGVLLLGLNLFLLLLAFTGIGLLISVPAWCLAVIVGMITATNAVHDHNARLLRPKAVIPAVLIRPF